MISKFAKIDSGCAVDRARRPQNHNGARRNKLWQPIEITAILKAMSTCPRGGQRAMLELLGLTYKAKITTGHLAYWRKRIFEESKRAKT